MDVEGESAEGEESDELISRVPEQDDIVQLCKRLNESGAKYVVVGGFAIIAAGLARGTEDVDLLIETTLENERKVLDVLAELPDGWAREIEPGEVGKVNVVRIADEILVDLMAKACGIDYAEAAQDVVVHTVDGVEIPFASPRLLWRMKKPTHRAKDQGDLAFLAQLFAERGEQPPKF